MPNYDDTVAELSRQLEVGLRNYMQNDEYTEYLNVMSQFHNYSYRNCALIAMQKPNASQVASYNTWQKLKRQVRKGEKAIRIIAPKITKKKINEPIIDEKTGEPLKNPDGTPVSDKNAQALIGFRTVSVFDISQTSGEPFPKINIKDLKDPVKNFDKYVNAIQRISNVPIRFSDIPESRTAKGYYDKTSKEIVIRKNMPEAQTLKTMIHELTHSILHDIDSGGRYTDSKTREIEAESTAYIVCKHFQLDTSDYSFPYITAWSEEADLATLNDSMTRIQKTASGIISDLTEELNIERRTQLKETMKVAGYEYDDERSEPDNIIFNRNDGAVVQMMSWDEVQGYVNTVILDDPDISNNVKNVAKNKIIMPEGYSEGNIKKAKSAIQQVFNDSTLDFSDSRHVDIAFTYTDKARQYSIDLISNRINIYDVGDYLNYMMQIKDEPADKYGILIESRQYNDIDELINKGLFDINKEINEQLSNTDKEKKREVENTVYVPAYDGNWKVVPIQLDKTKFWGKNDIVYNGMIYNNEVYATEKGAWDYINRTNNDGFSDRIEFDPDTHEPYFTAERYAEQKEVQEQRSDSAKTVTRPEKASHKSHGSPEL